MKKPFEKQPPRILFRDKLVKIAKQVRRAWGLATRLEYRRVKGKGLSKKYEYSKKLELRK